jgi:hypothetical protein
MQHSAEKQYLPEITAESLACSATVASASFAEPATAAK